MNNKVIRPLAVFAVAFAALGMAAPSAQIATAFPPTSGPICTSNPTNTFTLTAKSGVVGVPDGNTIYMWSYALGSGDFQLPGPLLCVTQGSTVTVTLNNELSEPVSVLFPGIENVQVGGNAAQPQFDGGGNLTSLTNAAAPNGSVTYTFVVAEPGTYLYHSGTDMAKQVQMGLYGAMIVRPAANANWAYNRADTQFDPNNEYVLLLSEVDPDLHAAVENNQPYDFTALHNRYWMINGRSFPDTIAPNGAPWLPSQPYGSLIHMYPNSGSNALPVLARYLSVGTKHHPLHPHGNHGRVIGRDGKVLEGSAAQDLAYEKFLVMAGAGQTWDVTYVWQDAEGWNPDTNPIPVTSYQQQNLTQGEYFGSPYLGTKDELPIGTTGLNECGEYYHMWHSHALNESANYEAAFGGMMTFQRIDPPLPNQCNN